jgi:hypothetical protein
MLCPFSLLTGNFTGNFAKLRLWERQRLQIMPVVAGFPTQIPYSTKQGIIFAEQGIWAGEQRFLSAEIEIVAGWYFGTKSLGWCLLLARKRTLIAGAAMSALCQSRHSRNDVPAY